MKATFFHGEPECMFHYHPKVKATSIMLLPMSGFYFIFFLGIITWIFQIVLGRWRFLQFECSKYFWVGLCGVSLSQTFDVNLQ